MKINADFRLFAAANFDAAKYIASPAYGVNRFMLDRRGDEKARATTIVEYQPNSRFPEHTHIGGEEFLVLDGTFKDQFGEFGAGWYIRNPIGSKHEPWVDEDGCTIFVKLLQMAETSEEPLRVSVEDNEESCANRDFGRVLELYQNVRTGEHVQMLWMDSGKTLPMENEATGGEELFVVKGSLFLDGSRYDKWGWLRFPAGAGDECRRYQLVAGPDGAQVYRKMGHLTEKALRLEKVQIPDE
jgi:hypothetical protein